ncbi:MAG: hypothetical protein H0X30_24110 [Anaerolineae bacterium]|nr:hypothetical protein [Anaerolineae bacterium]
MDKHLRTYAAVDPLSIVFSERVYLILVEKLHPHVPLIDVMNEAIKEMSKEEVAFSISMAKRLVEYGQVAEKALEKQHSR